MLECSPNSPDGSHAHGQYYCNAAAIKSSSPHVPSSAAVRRLRPQHGHRLQPRPCPTRACILHSEHHHPHVCPCRCSLCARASSLAMTTSTVPASSPLFRHSPAKKFPRAPGRATPRSSLSAPPKSRCPPPPLQPCPVTFHRMYVSYAHSCAACAAACARVSARVCACLPATIATHRSTASPYDDSHARDP